MCGIVAYTGSEQAHPILIDGLQHLEYRGYDSAGIAVSSEIGINTICRTGKVERLKAAVDEDNVCGTCGIGHTRWATHGKPTEANAHPHTSCNGDIAIVHNGIIENFMELRTKLESEGHVFKSDTDTEVIAHLIEDEYQRLTESGEFDPSQRGSSPSILTRAVAEAKKQLIGSYGIVAVCNYEPTTLVAVRQDSPLVVGLADDGSYAASDIVAILEHTRDIVVLKDGEIAELRPEGTTFYDSSNDDLKVIDPEVTYVDWDIGLTEKGGYPDFMLKEINEQPRVIRDTLAGRLVGDRIEIDELHLTPEELELIDRVYIIACGTSYHAGIIAKNLIESWVRIPTEVEVASEFRYRNPIITPSTLVVAVSQSGETADTIAAIRDARAKGARVFGITNVVGSTVAREADGIVYTKANKEIAVASTKSFTGQIASLALLALMLAQAKGQLTVGQVRLLFSELADTAEHVEKILEDCTVVDEAARACKDAASALFVGRGMGSAIALEGALKLKEISYLHAEAYPAGEMKHGPIALISDDFPIIAIATNSPTYGKVLSNLQECRARGAMVVAIATEGDTEIDNYADHVIRIPAVRDDFSAITASIPLQLFARSIAVMRGCDVDQPRNLAKSVTVE